MDPILINAKYFLNADDKARLAEEGRAGHETTREKSVGRERFAPSDYGVDLEDDEA